MIFSILFIPIFFYTYTYILGTHNVVIDILSFILSVFIGETIAYLYIINDYSCNSKIALFIIGFLTFIFILFTFTPPKLDIFQESTTGIYGIKK